MPLDFSAPSHRALRFAREWAAFFASEVCLLHVVEAITVTAEFRKTPMGTVQRDIVSRVKAALEKLARTNLPEKIRVVAFVRKGRAFDEIAAAARAFQADVIIIATRGHTGLRRLLLGSADERVVRHAPCPVMVLRRRPGC